MGKNIKREYIPLSKENHFLRVELYYSLGGYNYFTYETDPRGYWVSVSPVERADGWESFTLFSGVKAIALECQRQSKKRETEALSLYEGVKQKLIEYVLAEKGLELGDVA